MKKLGFALFFIAAVLSLSTQARATYTIKTFKDLSLTFIVTPSPTPIGYVAPPTASAQAIAQAAGFDRHREIERFTALMQPTALDRLVAWEPFTASDMMAQAAPQGNVKVQFAVKADPNSQYFHVVPGATTTFNAGYGSNTYTCAYQIFAKYATAWIVSDWVYGSNTSGGTAGLNGYPTYNYPTASQLSWLAEGITTTFKTFANAGSPGETAFTGVAGSSKTVCFDLTLNVPNSIPAGTYQTTIQYNFQISF